MVALVQENQAKVVLAEAEVPKAIADAFRSGNLGIMDYYGMQNIQADTRMRWEHRRRRTGRRGRGRRAGVAVPGREPALRAPGWPVR